MIMIDSCGSVHCLITFSAPLLYIQIAGEPPTTSLKRVCTKEQINGILSRFVNNSRTTQSRLLERLQEIRDKVQESPFFMSHEVRNVA